MGSVPETVWISHNGEDSVNCLKSHSTVQCRTLLYILQHSSGRVTTVYVEGSSTPYTECYKPGVDASVNISNHGLFIEGIPDVHGNLPVFDCSNTSSLFGFVSLWGHDIDTTIELKFTKLTLSNLVLTLTGPNTRVNFTDVTFSNGLVLSSSSNCEYLSSSFQDVEFVTTSAFRPRVVFFHPVQNVIGKYIESELTSSGAYLYCKKQKLTISNSSLNSSLIAAIGYISLQFDVLNVTNTGVSNHGSNILVVLGNPTLVSDSGRNRVNINKLSSSRTLHDDVNHEFSVVRIISPYYEAGDDNILIQNCRFEQGSRAIHVAVKQLREITITKSYFINNTAHGVGGSVRIFFASSWGGVVKFSNSVFRGNKAKISNTGDTSFSAGGAIFVNSDIAKCGDVTQPNVEIKNSTFQDNFAQAFGGSLYVGNGIFLKISDTEMQYNYSEHSWNGDLITAICRVAFWGVHMNVWSTNGETSIVEFVPIFETAFIQPKSLYINCPTGHYLDLRYLLLADVTLGGAFATFQSYCKSCSEKEYTPEFGKAHIAHDINSPFQAGKHLQANNVSCLPCPYGADCNVGLLRSRPQFWGYEYKGEYYFQRCPDGYCCNGGDIACKTFATCAEHRVGKLCGKCQSGYSESVLSTDCVEDRVCDDHWVWPVAIVGALFYIIYYMYKSEMVHLAVFLFESMLSVCEKTKPDTNATNDGKEFNNRTNVLNIHKEASPALSVKSEAGAASTPIPRHQSNIIPPLVPVKLNNLKLNNVDVVTKATQVDVSHLKSEVQWTSLLTKLSHLDPDQREKLADREETEGVDRGYLGIITYFAQASSLMQVHVEFANISYTSILDKMQEYTVKYLDFDVYQVELRICPFAGINALFKALIKTLFVLTIYSLWLIFFIITNLVLICSSEGSKRKAFVNRFRLKLIEGLVEVIKYTFSSLAGSNFSLLTCVFLGDDFVWKLDGTITCFQQWQGLAALFLLFYTIPFSFSLALGSKFLKEGKISSTHFLLSCIMPLPACGLWLCLYLCKWRRNRQAGPVPKRKKRRAFESQEKLSDTAMVILDVLQGPYRSNDETIISVPNVFHLNNPDRLQEENDSRIFKLSSAMYWEGVMVFRRLVLNALMLVNNDIIRLTVMSVICLIISLHHTYIKPFKLNRSNRAETLSLSFLLILCTMNAIKASFSESGTIPQGPNESLLLFFQQAGTIFLFVLISFILLTELFCFMQARYKKRKK